MKAILTHRYEPTNARRKFYSLPKKQWKEVTVVGVPIPCQPGWVLIKDEEENKQYEVPDFVLRNCPAFDFQKLMEERSPKLIPAIECPIKKHRKK